jgi:hypothetical protein
MAITFSTLPLRHNQRHCSYKPEKPGIMLQRFSDIFIYAADGGNFVAAESLARFGPIKTPTGCSGSISSTISVMLETSSLFQTFSWAFNQIQGRMNGFIFSRVRCGNSATSSPITSASRGVS